MQFFSLQPSQNHPSWHLGGWAMPWSAKSGHPCPRQGCSQWRSGGKARRGLLMTCPSCLHDDPNSWETDLTWPDLTWSDLTWPAVLFLSFVLKNIILQVLNKCQLSMLYKITSNLFDIPPVPCLSKNISENQSPPHPEMPSGLYQEGLL